MYVIDNYTLACYACVLLIALLIVIRDGFEIKAKNRRIEKLEQDLKAERSARLHDVLEYPAHGVKDGDAE